MSHCSPEATLIILTPADDSDTQKSQTADLNGICEETSVQLKLKSTEI